MAKRVNKSGKTPVLKATRSRRMVSTRTSRRKALEGTGFRSKLELDFKEYLDSKEIDFRYEDMKIPYVVPSSYHTYLPDFRVNDIIYETKGRLTREDRKKMLLVREQNPQWTFVFVLSAPRNYLYKGSPTTYSEWCDKNGFAWYDIRLLKQGQQLSNLNMTKVLEVGPSPVSQRKKKKS